MAKNKSIFLKKESIQEGLNGSLVLFICMKKYVLNPNIILRKEDFGGLIVSRETFVHMDINEAEYYLLEKVRENPKDIIEIKRIAQKIYNKKIRLHTFISRNVLCRYQYDKNTSMSTKKNYLSSPLEVTIYPTLKCNLNCKFCFVKNKNHNIDELSADIWVEFIRKMKNIGVISVSILGGEPSKYYDIKKLIVEAEKIGINITMTTNAYDLDEELINLLSGCRNIIPVVSLQSLSELNKQLTGISYEDVLKSIDLMLARGCTVRINSVYTNQKQSDFERIIDYCIEKGIQRYSIGVYMDINDSNIGVQSHTFEEARKLQENLLKYIRKKYGKNRFNVSIEGCMLYTAYPELERCAHKLNDFEKIYYGCRAGRSKLEVYPSGDVYPCICYENLCEPQGNIIKDDFFDIWEKSKKIIDLRNTRVRSESCIRCGFVEICNGGCPAFREKQFQDNYIFYKDSRCKLH